MWRAGSPGTLVAVATLQSVLSSDLGSKGEQETTYPQLLKWEHPPPNGLGVGSARRGIRGLWKMREKQVPKTSALDLSSWFPPPNH